ncbi:unnamed protein product, partial [Polarella glacialis]
RKLLRETVAPVLRRIFSFARDPEGLAALVAETLQETAVKRGTAIFKVGAPACSMFVVVTGTVELHARQAGAVGTLGPGSSFGEAALL